MTIAFLDLRILDLLQEVSSAFENPTLSLQSELRAAKYTSNFQNSMQEATVSSLVSDAAASKQFWRQPQLTTPVHAS